MIKVTETKHNYLHIASIQTPLGKLEAVILDNPDFPAVNVYINDELVSITECIIDEKRVRTLAYNCNGDEPENVTDYYQKKNK